MKIDTMWGLGNIHNYDELVCCAALFSSDLTVPDRELLSQSIAKFVSVSNAFEFAQECGKEGFRRHRSMIHGGAPAQDTFGLHRYRRDERYSGNQDEQRLSLAITEAFSRFLMLLSSLDKSGTIARSISCSREQFDDAKNSQDFVVNRTLRGGTLPAIVMEFASDAPRAPNDRKEPQLFQYICNNTKSLPDSKSPLAIGVPFLQLKNATPTFQIFGYYQAESDFHVVPITGEVLVDADSLARLFYVMACFAFSINTKSLPPRQLDAGMPVLRFLHGTGGVVTIEDTRIKVFNYANFSKTRIENGGSGRVMAEQRRTAEHSLRMLPEARVVNNSSDIQVLLYKSVPGDHEPGHSSCVAACVKHLDKAHNTHRIIHCDLHLGNFVFNTDNPQDSCVIDWDHARTLEDPGKYVDNWNHRLPERHPDARAGWPIRMAHERHSLGAVLARFEPHDAAGVSKWDSICSQALKEEVALGDLARQIESLNMNLRLKPPSGIVVTGSPPRDDNGADIGALRSQVTALNLGSISE